MTRDSLALSLSEMWPVTRGLWPVKPLRPDAVASSVRSDCAEEKFSSAEHYGRRVRVPQRGAINARAEIGSSLRSGRGMKHGFSG